MAARFWVGGTGVWDGVTTLNWSASSGGASGASVPGTSDTVTFDANSLTSAQTCTVATNFSVLSMSIGTMLGTLDFTVGNNSPTMGTFDGVGVGASGSFKMGNGTWTITGANQQVWNLQGTHLTFNANTSTLVMSGTGALMMGGAKTYNAVQFTGGGNMQSVRGDTYASLLVQSNGVVGSQFIVNTGLTITGAFTCTGSNIATSRVYVNSPSKSFQITITAASVVLTNTDFTSIVGAGAATWSGTSIGNGGNNSNISFTTPVTRFWVGNGGNWGDTARWSATTGGSSGATVPLCHDTVTFDANSFSSGGQTIACNVFYLGKDIDFSAVTNSPSWNTGVNAVSFQGSLTLKTGMTMNSSNTSVSLTTFASVTITTAGVTMNNSWVLDGAGTLTLQDAFSGLNNRPFSVLGGTLTTNNFNFSVGSLQISSGLANPKTLNAGTSTLTFTANSSNYFSFAAAVSTINASNATFICQNADSLNKNVNMGTGKTIGTLTFQGTGSGTDTIIGSSTIGTLNISYSISKTFLFTASITTTITSAFNSSAGVGTLYSLVSTVAGTKWNMIKSSGTVSVVRTSIKDSTVSGGAKFFALINDNGCVRVGINNSGWLFDSNFF